MDQAKEVISAAAKATVVASIALTAFMLLLTDSTMTYYGISSGCTIEINPNRAHFSPQDFLWHGMLDGTLLFLLASMLVGAAVFYNGDDSWALWAMAAFVLIAVASESVVVYHNVHMLSSCLNVPSH